MIKQFANYACMCVVAKEVEEEEDEIEMVEMEDQDEEEAPPHTGKEVHASSVLSLDPFDTPE